MKNLFVIAGLESEYKNTIAHNLSLQYNACYIEEYSAETIIKFLNDNFNSYNNIVVNGYNLSHKERKTFEKDAFEKRVRGIVEQIRECSSETTFYQIMGKLKTDLSKQVVFLYKK